MFALLIGGAGWGSLGGFNIYEPTVWKVWYAVLLLVAVSTVYSGVSDFAKNYKLIQNKF